MSSISFDHQRFHNSLLLFFWVLGSASFNWYSHSSNFLRSIFSFSFRYKLLYHDRCLCSACSVLIVIFELHPFWQFHFFHVSELWSIPLFGCLSFAWGYSWHLLAVAGLWVVFLSIVNRMWSWWCFSISVQSFLGKVGDIMSCANFSIDYCWIAGYQWKETLVIECLGAVRLWMERYTHLADNRNAPKFMFLFFYHPLRPCNKLYLGSIFCSLVNMCG